MRIPIIAVLALAGLLTAQASYAAAAPEEKAVDAILDRFVSADAPGVAVGIYRGGRVVYERGRGLADLEHRVPVTPATVFHIASVSKQFTALAVSLLVREGKVDLNADIRSYLPYMPDFGAAITVRDLLQQTSGLRDNGALLQLAGRDLRDLQHQQHVINLMQRQRALNFSPGTAFQYSNTNYALLAQIVEAASGQRFRDFTTERIFRPLGMSHSHFCDDVTETVAHRASSYERDAPSGAWKRSPLNLEVVGTTGMVSTVGDMLKWARNFAQPTVGDAELIERMGQRGKLRNGASINYGFALTRHDFAGHEALMHPGGDAGYRSIFAYFPAEDFAVVLLMATPYDLYEPVRAITAWYLKEGARREAQKAPIVKPDRALLQAAAGHYLRSTGKMISIEVSGDELTWNILGMPPAKVVFRADGTFDLGQDDWRWDHYRFVQDGAGRVSAIEETWVGGVSLDPRVERADPSVQELAELTGRYYGPELDVTYTFAIREGRLTASTLWSKRPVVFVPRRERQVRFHRMVRLVDGDCRRAARRCGSPDRVFRRGAGDRHRSLPARSDRARRGDRPVFDDGLVAVNPATR